MGHEDIGYSYVVVRRGSKPITGDIKVGRVGAVGKRAMDKDTLSRARGFRDVVPPYRVGWLVRPQAA